MKGKSYWMWHYGDYEIYHTMRVNLRREVREVNMPAFWKISSPCISIKFRKRISSEGGYMLCRLCGDGYVRIDDMIRYGAGVRIDITPGEHLIEIYVSNFGGLPAAYVESDICPSGEGWSCNGCAGEFSPVGWKPYFDCADKTPDVFPF